jgi:hypothetical protein
MQIIFYKRKFRPLQRLGAWGIGVVQSSLFWDPAVAGTIDRRFKKMGHIHHVPGPG